MGFPVTAAFAEFQIIRYLFPVNCFGNCRISCITTGEYPRVQIPVIFSKAITRTRRVFRHGYPPPTGDTTGYPHAQVPTGESGYHYQDLWYLWYPLVRVW